MVSQIIPLSASATGPPVLIVENERTSRRAMAALLSGCGFQPAPFESAEDALQAVLDGTHPRFALVDLDLPGMNGLDLISRLKSVDPTIFPILITATDQDILAARLQDRPVTYLRKPINFDTLLTLMTEQQHRH
jgi:two-component system C4-dicarboxylate transport response regulator DctD